MAVLTQAERDRIKAQIQRRGFGVKNMSSVVAHPNVTKPVLATAVAAADDWLESAWPSYTAALAADATAFNTAATVRQRAILLAMVILERAQLLRIEGE